MTANSQQTPAPEPFLIGMRQVRFEALQRRLAPRSAGFSSDQWQTSRTLINNLLSKQATGNRKKLALFLVIIDVISFFTGLRPFRNLPENRQDWLLRKLFDSPVGLLRKGFWGLNTLAKLGVYGDPSLYEEIGYRLRENTNV